MNVPSIRAGFFLFFLGLLPLFAHADGRSYNTSGILDWVMVEERRPYFEANNWSPFCSQTPIYSEEGASFGFYTGFGNSANEGSVWWHWSTWPISNPINPGDALKVHYYGTHTSGHDGEGGNGTEGTSAGLTGGPSFPVQTNVWYRFALRCWQPLDGTPHKGYAGEWIREEPTGIWYHAGTFETPFAVTGVSGINGFIERFDRPGGIQIDFRNAYAHQVGQPAGVIQNANQLSGSWNGPDGSGVWHGGHVGLSPDGSYAFMSALRDATVDPLGASYPINSAGNTVSVTLTNQPAVPVFDPIVVSSSSAAVHGSQLLVAWEMPNTSSPQLGYIIDVFDNPSYTGSPVVSFAELEPETRQKLLDITGVATPYARLTITDIFDNTNTPIHITTTSATLNSATPVTGAVNGLDYAYYEAPGGVVWSTLPDFAPLTPVLQGAVNDVDTTPRKRRSEYGFDYSGYIEVPTDGLYSFTLSSFDSSKLFVNGIEVIDFDGQHQPAKKSGWIALAAGKHSISVQYAFSYQRGQTVYKDDIDLTYEGPGISLQSVPLEAWFRVPGGSEPTLALTSPVAGTTIIGANIDLTVSVAPNGATLNKVQYFMDNVFLGESDEAPYSLSTFLGEAPTNAFRARLHYNGSYTLDSSPPTTVAIENMDLYPWELTSIGTQHLHPTGGKVEGGTLSLIGDSVNLLSRQITGDCTFIARLSDITSSATLPDGTSPDGGAKAGIILRSDLSPHTGQPLGLGFFSVYGQVDGSIRYQDSSMVNAGGGYSSGNLGGGNKWFKLERTGNTCVTSISADGVNWNVVNTSTIDIGATVYAAAFQFTSGSPVSYIPQASFADVSLVGNVVGPPDVSVSPQAATVYAGQPATFTAGPVGSAPFGYQWQYNGANIANATNDTLVISTAQPYDSGIYTVVMTNAGGTDSASGELAVLTPIPVTEEILAKDPLGYWRLNDVGPTAEDVLGNYDGTGQGGVAFGVTGVGSPFSGFESGTLAAQFNGSDSSVAIPPLDITTTNFTITGWAKRSGSQNNWSGLVFGRHTGNRGAGIMIVDNKLRFSWDDDGDYNWGGGPSLPDNQWVFFALTIEPTRSILYLSTGGALSAYTWTGSNNGLPITGNFHIGKDSSGGSGRHFNGAIDEVVFYNRTLSAAELTDIANASLVAAPDVALTTPVASAEFAAPADIGITASVSANGHTISKIQFFNGSALLGEDSTAPYSLAWNGVAAGSYTLLAQAIYDGASTMSSAPVNIRVLTPPSAATSPNPPDGSTNVASNVQLSWAAGSLAASHNVYFGISPTPALQGNQPGTTFEPGSLQGNTTYYWAVDEVNSAGTTPGPVWSFTTAGNSISINFQRYTAESFAGSQLIGPLGTDSSHWNEAGGANGSHANLINSFGEATVADVQWGSSTLWSNNDGTGDDEHKLATGYLDDGNSGSGKGVTITLSNIPYATYKVYGLFATDQNSSGSSGTVNFNVNGTWALDGSATTTAPAWGSIGANDSANGSYWTEIVPGSVQGNYWVVESDGATCSIVGERGSGSNRGCLTAVIIEDMGGVFTTNAPTWNSSPVSKADAPVGVPYSGSLLVDAIDLDGDTLTFSKGSSDPAWLTIASNGDLGGTPSITDAGSNSWTVTVTDGITAPVTNTLNLSVVSKTTVNVANYSFELPGTSKQQNWEAVPGWSSDFVAADSGVENAGATEGSWAGYLMESDPAVWNLTDEFIAPGELYTLRVDAKNTGSGSSLRIRLYYDNAGSRVSLATLDAALSGTMQEFELQYNSDDAPAAVGKHIGIELDNVAGGWVGFDHVRLTRTGAPDSDGDLMPDWWENDHGLNSSTNDRAVHSDSDVYDNWAEYVTDTDPQDGNSWQTFSLELAPGTGIPTLHFGTSTRRNYVVEYRDDLTGGTWQELVPIFVGDGTEMAQPDAAVGPQRYYRLRINFP